MREVELDYFAGTRFGVFLVFLESIGLGDTLFWWDFLKISGVKASEPDDERVSLCIFESCKEERWKLMFEFERLLFDNDLLRLSV